MLDQTIANQTELLEAAEFRVFRLLVIIYIYLRCMLAIIYGIRAVSNQIKESKSGSHISTVKDL